VKQVLPAPWLPRRRLIGVGAASLAGALASCQGPRGSRPSSSSGDASPAGQSGQATPPGAPPADPWRIVARPNPDAPVADIPPGTHALGLASRRDTLLYVPAGYAPELPAPLAVLLHGAGGEAEHGLALLQPLADAAGILLVAPASRRQTWDVLLGGYGPDVAHVDRALRAVFERHRVDADRLAIGGFSDGASYALSLGLSNGDLFGHIIAFAPGFMAPAEQNGRPRIYVSHGTRDTVLPIDRCSRRIVPQLEDAGYPVRYHEFEGPHTVPPDIAAEAATWFMDAAE
jgi:phospholipase/carboxylesterase